MKPREENRGGLGGGGKVIVPGKGLSEPEGVFPARSGPVSNIPPSSFNTGISSEAANF